MDFSRYPHWAGISNYWLSLSFSSLQRCWLFSLDFCVCACGRCVWPAILTPSPHPTSVWLESPGPMTQLMVVSGTVNSSYCCSIGRFSNFGIKDFFSHIQIHSTVGTLNASYLRTVAATLKAFGALQSCALSQPQTSGFNGPCEKVSFNMEKNIWQYSGSQDIGISLWKHILQADLQFCRIQFNYPWAFASPSCLLFTKESQWNDNKLISVNSHWSMCQPGCLTLFPLQWMIVNHFSLIPSK